MRSEFDVLRSFRRYLAMILVGPDGVAASAALSNTSPTVALTLTAKAPGLAGNSIRVTTADHFSDATKDTLRVYNAKGVAAEKYDYAQTNITALAADINSRSALVAASGVVSGTALAHADVHLAGGDTDWEVRFDGEAGAVRLPMCLVSFQGGTGWSGPAHSTDVTGIVSVACSMEQQDTIEAAAFEASRVADMLYEGFRVGVGMGEPMRVPMYDYAAVPLDAPGSSRGRHDYIRITDLPVTPLPDPDDQRRQSVQASIRVSWRRRGRVFSNPQAVESIQVKAGDAE